MPVTSGPTCRPTSGRRCCGRGTGCPTGPAPSCSRSRSVERSPSAGRWHGPPTWRAPRRRRPPACSARRSTQGSSSTSPRTAGTGSTTRCRPRPWRVDSRERNVDGCTRRSPGPAPPTSTTRRVPPRPRGSLPTSAVAEHHARAGHDLEAYRWTLRAADLADRLDDRAGLLGLLGRLVDLRDRVEVAADSPVELLERLRHVAARIRRPRDRARRRRVPARPARRGDRTPASSAELLRARGHTSAALPADAGRGCPFRADLPRWGRRGGRRARAGAGHRPPAGPRLRLRRGRDGPSRSRGGRRVGARSHRSRGGGRGVRLVGLRPRHPVGGRTARRHGAPRSGPTSPGVAADSWRPSARHTRTSRGCPRTRAGPCSAPATGAGVPSACASPSGSDPGAAGDVTARLTAARLAVLQGRQREAEDHLARADELFAETTGFLAFEFDAVRAEVRLGAGDAEGAHEAAMAGALSPGVPPTLCEWLCPLAARALADLAETIPRGGPPGRAGPGATRRPRRPVPPRHRGQHVRLAGVRGAAGRAGRALRRGGRPRRWHRGRVRPLGERRAPPRRRLALGCRLRHVPRRGGGARPRRWFTRRGRHPPQARRAAGHGAAGRARPAGGRRAGAVGAHPPRRGAAGAVRASDARLPGLTARERRSSSTSSRAGRTARSPGPCSSARRR